MSALTLLASFVAVVQPGDPAACAQIVDDRDRLACYDAAVGRTAPRAAAPIAQPAPVAQAPRAPSVAAPAPVAAPTTDASRFGLSARPVEEPDQINGTVASVSLRRDGTALIRLDDGQVWEQLGSDRIRLRAHRFDQVSSVEIEKRRFGGFRMRIEPLGRSVLVRRVK